MVKWVKDKLQQILRNEEGMTLIELVAVIVIIGIIAAVAIPLTLNAVNNSRVKTAIQNESIIQSALERYAQDHNGLYPTAANWSASDLTQNVLVTGNYINSIPTDPWNQNAPTYQVSSDQTKYNLYYKDGNNGKYVVVTNSTPPAETSTTAPANP